VSFDVSELLTLYDIVFLSFPERDEELGQEVVEKSTRLFGVRRLALVIRQGEKQKCIGYWGFQKEQELWVQIEKRKDNSFIYLLENGNLGFVYFEQVHTLSDRDKRLYTIFGHRIESILVRRQIEEKLRDSEREKAAILDSMSELLVFQDTENRILWANKAAAESVGLTPAELAGRVCYEVWHQRNKPCHNCPVVKALKTGCPQEGTMTFPDGRVWFIRGYPIKNQKSSIEGVVKITMDITARQRAEEALNESEERFRYMVELSPFPLAILDTRGSYEYINPQFTKVFGYTLEDVSTGEKWFELAYPDPDYRRKVLAAWLEDIKAFGENNGLPRVFNVTCKDGLVKEIMFRFILMKNGKHFITYEDTTERIRAERALKASENVLRVIFNNVYDAVFIHEPDGAIIDVNEKMLQMYGVDDKEEAIRLSFEKDYSSPDNPLEQLPYLWKRAISGESQFFEWKARRPGNGSLFDVEVFFTRLTLVNKDVILATVRDISDRKREEEFLRNLFIFSPIGMYIVIDGKFQSVNSQFAKYSGYSQEELIGVNPLTLVVPEDKNMVREKAVKMLKGELSSPYEFRIVSKEGKIKWVTESVTSLWYKGKRATLGNFMDITERKEFEEKLKYLSLHDQLTGLYNRAFFEEELHRLSDSREYPITIISADLDGLKLINDTMGHKRGDELLKKCKHVLKKSLRRSDILARVGGDEFAAILSRCNEKSGEAVVKRIRLLSEHYNRKHPALPLSISIGIATAAASQQSLHDVLKKADEMMYRDKLYRSASTRSQLVNTLLAALSEKDYIAEGHVQRVHELCQKLGKKLSLSSRQLTDLSLLARVHDLGKVGIPDSILFKTGPLTVEEMEIMRQHSEIGYRIASSSPDLSTVAELILRHHEKWDGSGYPLGLKGKGIPIECRILSLADAFDAITSHRPYRTAKSKEEAVKEIQESSGTQFDPDLVEKFLLILEEDGKY
jgi:diguanylate cyclase (GGDEF)-like protein/PAS domain S-box-containing protein